MESGQEVWVVLVKSRRAKLWRPLEVESKRSCAVATMKRVIKAWPKMEVRVGRFVEGERLREALEKVSLILSGWATDRLGIQGCALKDYVDAALEGK